MSIKYFDMFAGIGGFRSGLEAIGGFECVGYCEIDKYANQAYKAMYDTGGELYFDDARKIGSLSIVGVIRKMKGSMSIVGVNPKKKN